MKKLFLSIILISLLSSCIETLAIGGIAGSRLAMREKSFVDTKDDVVLNTKIVNSFSKNGLKKPGNSIDVIVNESRVLLTGIVSDVKMAKKAKKLAWKVHGVKEVIDEIQIAKNGSRYNGFKTYSKDATITSQIKTRFFFTKNVSTLNIDMNTVNGIVYVIGVASNNREISKVTKLIAKTQGVRKVVSHIIKTNDVRRRKS